MPSVARRAVAHEGRRLFGRDAAEAAGLDDDRGAVLLDDLGLDEIHAAEEVGDLAVDRALVDLLGRGDLRDPAAEHHGDAVGHGERLVLVVGDQHEGDADRLLQAAQLDLHLLAQLLVERRQRLVEQQHLRPHHQRAGQRDALALAAGQLVRAALAEPGQRHLRQRLLDAAPFLRRAEPAAASARRRRSARR